MSILIFPRIYRFPFRGGPRTEVFQYIEEDMIWLIWYVEIWYNWLIYLEQRYNLGKSFFYPHYINIPKCANYWPMKDFNMSTCTWHESTDVLKYILKKMSSWPVLVLGIYISGTYMVYLSTWSTVLDPNPDVLRD